jgi:hypothetical protein
MPQQTLAQARVIDPVLTAVAKGYEPQNFIADILFPRVTVLARGGNIISFGREAFTVVNSKRAPGTDTKFVQVGYGAEKFSLVDNRLIGLLPIQHMQEGMAVPNIDQGALTIFNVQDKMDREREVDAAILARTASAYATTNRTAVLSGTDLWTDAASNPFNIINTGKEAVRQKIGKRPNTMVLGPKALTALRNHPSVLDRISTSTDRAPATLSQLAALFEIATVVEGEAIQDSGNTMVDIWGTDVILAYVAPRSLQNMGSMNYGYTYQLENYPVVEVPTWNTEKESWMYPVSDARQVVFTSVDSGYLIRNAVAP